MNDIKFPSSITYDNINGGESRDQLSNNEIEDLFTVVFSPKQLPDITNVLFESGKGTKDAITKSINSGKLLDNVGKVLERATINIQQSAGKEKTKKQIFDQKGNILYKNLDSIKIKMKKKSSYKNIFLKKFGGKKVLALSNGLETKEEVNIRLPFNISQFATTDTHNWEMKDDKLTAMVGEAIEGTKKILNGEYMKGGMQVGKAAVAHLASKKVIPKVIDLFAQTGVSSFIPQRKVFKGSTIYTFNFEWTMIPRNQKEANDIKTIIALFKYLSEYQKSSTLSEDIFVPALRRSPAIWKIQFPVKTPKFPGVPMLNKKNNFFCTLDDISSKPIGNQWGTFHEDGMMSGFTVSIKFSEYFNIHSAEDKFGNFEDFLESQKG